MNPNAIFWPVILQAALTFAVYLVMAIRRSQAVRQGQAKASDYRIPVNEPAASATAARSLANQFELPVLFYVVCILLHLTNGTSYLSVSVAWVFAVSRVLHAAVHLTSNRLALRQPLFTIGFIAVVFLWGILALNILS